MLCSARDAIHIPSRSTAHWIESADDVAAGGVIATRRRVRNAALAAARATCDGVADALRDVDAVCVPTELAADGFDFAYSGAAELIGAARFRMDKERVAAVGAIRWSIAEIRRVRCTGFIPRARAAGWIEIADE